MVATLFHMISMYRNVLASLKCCVYASTATQKMEALTIREDTRVNLPQDEIPSSWYNIQSDLSEPLPPPLDSSTRQPVNPQSLERIFAKELIRQEISSERSIRIPEEVREAYLQIGRPTPLVRAKRLEKFLRTPAKIYYKAEYLSPTGSNKPNTAIAQAYYTSQQGTTRLVTHENSRYCLGSVMNHVLLHQSIIGLEARKQFEAIDVEPDIIAGCIGGGSNFAGFAYPFMTDKLKGRSNSRFVACEPKAVPSTTRGVYTYDFGDTAEMTPLLKMYTIGHKYASPPIHSGGLRYHGKAPSLSYLINKGYMESVAYNQNEDFKADRRFAQPEGMVPETETAQ